VGNGATRSCGNNADAGSACVAGRGFAATFLVALEGGSAAVLGHLDIFGVLVLSFVSALGGGIVRDLLIGAVPPNAIRDWRYAATALFGGLCLLFTFHVFTEVPTGLLVALDAAGLALFAVAGADKALEFGIHPLLAVLMGCVTGCGGGVVRDLLLTRVPAVLRADVYATAALAGAAIAVVLLRTRVPRVWAMSAGAVACFALRMVAVAFHWQLPHVAGY
jgi:uncharacterized membrane protein YeiH